MKIAGKKLVFFRANQITIALKQIVSYWFVWFLYFMNEAYRGIYGFLTYYFYEYLAEREGFEPSVRY